MASVYDIKPAFQKLLRPLTRALAGMGVTANQVTLAALVLSIGVGVVVALWTPREVRVLWVLPAAFLVRMALNAIDGMLAREHGQKSRLGAVLNEVGDVLSDAAMYAPLAFTGVFPAPWIAALVPLAAASELAGVMGQVLGGARQYQGPMGKSDRAVVVSVLAMVLGAGLKPGSWIHAAMALVVALLVWTIINRAKAAVRGAPSNPGAA